MKGENGEDAVLQVPLRICAFTIVFSHGAIRLTFWGSAPGTIGQEDDVCTEREASEEDEDRGFLMRTSDVCESKNSPEAKRERLR